MGETPIRLVGRKLKSEQYEALRIQKLSLAFGASSKELGKEKVVRKSGERYKS